MPTTEYKAKVKLHPHHPRVLPMLEEARGEVIRLRVRVAYLNEVNQRLREKDDGREQRD